MLVIAAGCGAAVVPESADTTTSTTTSGAPATTAMLDSTAPPDPSTSSSETSGTSSEGYELPKLDVAVPDVGPLIETCATEGAALGDVTIVTPSGPFAATHAWWAWHHCCVSLPMLVLADASELEISEGAIITPHVMVRVHGSGKRQESPYIGEYDVGVRDVASTEFDDVMTGVELLEPLDSEVPTEPLPSFVAALTVGAGDWSITGSVNAPYCAAAQSGPCTCE